jgi:hypothetical protein
MVIKVAVSDGIEAIPQAIELIGVGQLVSRKPAANQLLSIEKIDFLLVTFHVRDVFSCWVGFHLVALLTRVS